jgi:hypothetical protein
MLDAFKPFYFIENVNTRKKNFFRRPKAFDLTTKNLGQP